MGPTGAPPAATRAVVRAELSLGACGKVEWSEVVFTRVEPRAPRRVRLATVHLRPKPGKTPRKNADQFAPLIEEAARQKADLVVLPETLTFYGTRQKLRRLCRTDPRPVDRVLRHLAKKHDLYIVAGLLERDGTWSTTWRC